MPDAPRDPLDRHSATPAELKQRLEADRAGRPYLLYRDAEAHQVLHVLADEQHRLVLGRDASSDVRLDWDGAVSAVHAIFERVGRNWVLIDDRLSKHGTYVNTKHIQGRQRLRPDDRILVGQTILIFRMPEPAPTPSTAAQPPMPVAPQLSQAQRRVLVALCRPYGTDPARLPITATNNEIAGELELAEVTVKAHLRALFDLFGIDDVQTRKRVRLMERAFALGAVSFHDYH